MGGAMIGRTLCVHLFLFTLFDFGSSQQAYLNNKQFDCYVNHSNTLGYTCNGPLHSCTAYLTFRSSTTYPTVPSIAYLLSANATAIADANNVTDVASFPEGQLLYVPVNCSCQTVSSGNNYYQHNALYRLKRDSSFTYLTVANDTYEGLTTCQAMMAQNKYDSQDLEVGEELQAPLMCACPSASQTQKGFKYVVSYLATPNDDVSIIAALFGVDVQTILDANELDSSSTIYPYNPILVPFKSTPTKIKSNPSPPPPPANTPPNGGGGGGSSSSKKWVFTGIGIGAALVALPILLFFLFMLWRRRNRKQQAAAAAKKPSGDEESGGAAGYKSLPGDVSKYTSNNSWSISSDGVRYAIESLTVYKAEELRRATENFSESRRIKGSVYRGEFNGDEAAVKVLNGDVSAEINILKQINHSNIIRLSGFCVDGGNTYLVYEMAERGSLREMLSSQLLSWKQRVDIALGVGEALNYLHNYCSPPYVHKNLSSTNVLLDANLRAKISNFALARTVLMPVDEEEEGQAMHLTRHVVGTKGYMSPEYVENGIVTPKMDVYAFGMLLLELMSGRAVGSDATSLTASSIREVLSSNSGGGNGSVREKLRRFMDSSLRDDRCPYDQAYSMAELANMCLSPDLNSRLSISEVLVPLSKIHSSSLHSDPSDHLLHRTSSLTQGRSSISNVSFVSLKFLIPKSPLAIGKFILKANKLKELAKEEGTRNCVPFWGGEDRFEMDHFEKTCN
ncbi:hypothetical protein V2J09_000429 [Rumex salicifolius]